MIELKTLYKLDTKGKVRIWRMEVQDNMYRTIAGLEEGKQVTSEWTVALPKNVGKANESTGHEQAKVECYADYAKKLRIDYHKERHAIVDGPKIFKPMLATEWSKRKDKIDFENKTVYIQPKLDGIRCIMTVEGMFTRTGKKITAAPHIVRHLAEYFEAQPDSVLDGELYNHDLKNDFNQIISMVRKEDPTPEQLKVSEVMVQYHVYDAPTGNELFSGRYQNLIDWLPVSSTVKLVETIKVDFGITEIDNLYGQFIEQGYEGGIIRLDSLYEQKRSNNLIKRKDFEDAEFEIIRIEEGQGNWSGCAKRVVFRLEDGRECGSGLKGSMEVARQVLAEAEEYIGKQVTVQFFTRTPDGVPRFPISKVLHKDKRW